MSNIKKSEQKLRFEELSPFFNQESAPSRVDLQETLKIERIIVKKSTTKEGVLYLVKWHGRPNTETTWKSKSNVDQHSLSEYFPHRIDHHRLLSAANAFEDGIQDRVRPNDGKDTTVIRFDLDIFRHCFQTDKKVILNCSDDFSRLPLSESWYYMIDKNGCGLRIKFPIRIAPKLKMKKIYVKIGESIVMKRKPIETLRIISSTGVFWVK